MRSQGALLLTRTGQTQESIAAKVGKTRVSVSQWLNGATKPSDGPRGIMLEAYGIPKESWDEPAHKRKPSTPKAESGAGASKGEVTKELLKLAQAAISAEDDEIPDGVLGKAEWLENFVQALMKSVADDPEAAPLERARVAQSCIQTLAHIAKLTGQFELGAKFFKLPVWKKIERALEVALEAHPQAAADVARELRKVEAENTYDRP